MFTDVCIKSKILRTVFAILISVLLFACFKKVGGTTTSVTARLGATQITVRLFASGEIDDKSFNAAAWRGITNFYGDTPENPRGRGVYYDFTIANSPSERVSSLRLMAEGGYDLIVIAGADMADSLAVVAPKYPKQNFMIVGFGGLGQQNVMGVEYFEEQGAFLVGVAAALQAAEVGAAPKFGFIGGVPGAIVARFQVGYMQGILQVSPDAEIFDYYANDWSNPAKAKIKSNAWYDSGVYAIFSAAGFTGLGVIQAAKERRQNRQDVWAIGVDSDQYGEGVYEGRKSAVLTSMIKRIDAAVELALSQVKNGVFKGEVLYFDLKVGGVGIPEINPNLSAATLQQIHDYKEKIINGTIVVDCTIADFTSPGHLGQGLPLFTRYN